MTLFLDMQKWQEGSILLELVYATHRFLNIINTTTKPPPTIVNVQR